MDNSHYYSLLLLLDITQNCNLIFMRQRSIGRKVTEIVVYCFLQLSAKKRYVYGAIAVIWISIPSLEITFTALITDIVNGTCVRFPVNNSYVVMKTVGFFTVFVSFLLPLTLMVFCYARVILVLRSEVILP